MKPFFIIIFSLLSLCSSAQIVAPDTVCVGSPISFTTPQSATTYAWDYNAMSVAQPISPSSIFYAGAALNVPSYGVFTNDGGNYYFFAINYPTEELIRFSFGSNIRSTPVITNLGSLGLTGTDLDGVDIVKDSATNQWYGVLTDYSQMAILSFGAHLSGTPTSIIHSFASPIQDWAHQTTIKKYNGNWSIFLANRHTNITRFDFGTSLTSTPVAHVLPNVAGLSSPVAFNIYQQTGNWYMLISDLLDNTLVRYNFGTDLQNNTPTGTALGNPGGLLNLPRPISILTDCQNHVIAYVGNEDGDITKLDFAGDITSTPTATHAASTGMAHFATAVPCSYADSFAYIGVDAIGNDLVIYNPLDFSTPTDIKYYTPTDTHTFGTTGTYHVSLFCDMGYATGPSVYCKDVVVTAGTATTTSRDTNLCSATPITVTAHDMGTHLWNTGDTTAAITATRSGVFWVATVVAPCVVKTDTIHVTLGSFTVYLGPDTAFCTGSSLTFAPSVPAGSSVSWSTGASSPSIIVSTGGTYSVVVNSGGCIARDTVRITVSPPPPVHLGHDTTTCSGVPVILRSSDSYTSPVYLWNTGSAAATISPTMSGTYWLHVTVGGCTGGDSVSLTIVPSPTINLGNDTTFCAPDSRALTPVIPGDALYTWSTGALTPSIIVNSTGTYWIKINLGGCTGTDTIHVTVNPKPIVDLGPDDTACAGGPALTLHSSVSYTSPAFLWSTGSTAASINAATTNIYSLAVTVDGCTGRDTMRVTLEPKPTINLGNDTAICAGDTITLGAAEPEGTTYAWGEGGQNPFIKVSLAGQYLLTVTRLGCSATDTIVITGLSKPIVMLGNDTSLCDGQMLQLSSTYDTLTWSNATTGTSIEVTKEGMYWASKENKCGVASDTITVTYDLCDLSFPSAFTPNDDGKDDIARPLGHFTHFTGYELDVYNRWGNRVFQTSNVIEGWDGKYHGIKQDIGTYFYMIHYNFEGSSRVKKGSLELIR